MLGAPVGRLERVVVGRDGGQRPFERSRVPGELDRGRIGQELALPAARGLHERREQRRDDAQQPGHDQQEDPDEEAHGQRGQRVVVIAAPDECAVLPAFDDQPEEAVGDEGDEADQDRDVQRVAGVEVADVPELVPDDALELLAIHRSGAGRS